MQGRKKVVVIGGGPAGLMAAGQASEQGADVILLEKNHRPARKLRITGKGRCNLTNTAPLTEFITNYGKNGRFLRSAFSRFFSTELLEFFDKLGVKTESERGGRIFPVSNQAQDVVDSLVTWAKNNGVEIRTNAAVKRIKIGEENALSVIVSDPERNNPTYELNADAVILAVGGTSYPSTGSTGDGYRIAAELGHTIIPVRPALVPLRTAGETAQKLQGLSLKNIEVLVYIENQLADRAFGEMLFTHFGISGPIILTLSRSIVDALLENKRVSIGIDLKPALDQEKLDARLRRDLDEYGRRTFKHILAGLLPRKLIEVCIDQVSIPADKPGHQITSEERERLRCWLKDFRLEITEPMPISTALVTAGGIHLKEINPKTMESRLIPDVFFAGEILDLDGDTGGYNLQAAFSTGWVAGNAAAAKLLSPPSP
ncbi:MAG: NAD(P)/FAD-dependent oxidoreductase [Anaerolineales bacterium]|nr:NAD(P)/FAD-dependent oxidoreductase [Anaerolineales bacterium]